MPTYKIFVQAKIVIMGKGTKIWVSEAIENSII